MHTYIYIKCTCVYTHMCMCNYMFIVCLSPLECELHENRKLVLFNAVPFVPRHIVGAQ